MKDKFIFDLGRIMDEVFGAAKDFQEAFGHGFHCGPKDFKHGFRWDENVDYYPAYHYPPTNVYLTNDRNLVFEFALAGFDENSIDLQFKGDHMVLNAKVIPVTEQEEVKYFKRRLKFHDIENQKYYVPENKFDREKVMAVYKNGLLRVTIPPQQDFTTEEGVKIEIVKEGE